MKITTTITTKTAITIIIKMKHNISAFICTKIEQTYHVKGFGARLAYVVIELIVTFEEKHSSKINVYVRIFMCIYIFVRIRSERVIQLLLYLKS